MFGLENDASWCNHDLSVRSWRILMVTKWHQVKNHAGEVPTGVFPDFPGKDQPGLHARPASMQVRMRALVSSGTAQQCPYPGHVNPGISDHNPFDILLGA